MLKGNEEYSQNEKLLMFLHGSSFTVYTANNYKDRYAKFKANEEQELSDSDSKSMIILSILDRLGNPMEELGTYLYKEVIVEFYDSLNVLTGKRTETKKCRNLLAQLNDRFSQLYHNFARNI